MCSVGQLGRRLRQLHRVNTESEDGCFPAPSCWLRIRYTHRQPTYTFLFSSPKVPKEPQCLSPRPNWDPTPSPATPTELRRGGGCRYTLAAFEGVGESQFGRLEKKLSTLSTLCFFISVLFYFFKGTTVVYIYLFRKKGGAFWAVSDPI